MKKLSLLWILSAGLFMFSCGGDDAAKENDEENTELADHECCSADCPEDCEMHAEEKKHCQSTCDKTKCGGECDKSKCEGKCDKSKCDKSNCDTTKCDMSKCDKSKCDKSDSEGTSIEDGSTES
ncbi:MAG: hypothetical protein R2780_12950 [Crocinitomicaceae bacterium]|nr:hypothetical protein [Crocinitomicaceae bacterium]